MASYTTKIGDTEVLLEAPVASALTKSASEERPDPSKAIQNVFDTIEKLVAYTSAQLGPTLAKTGAAFELSFAVRADTSGLTMISEGANIGQFQCTLKFPPVRPASRPTSAPQLTQRPQG